MSGDKVRSYLDQFQQKLDLDKKMGEIKSFVEEHPVMSLFLMINIAMCSIPVICFILFVVGSVLLAMVGFLFIEGTVLTIGLMVLGFVLFIVGLCSFGLGLFILVAYYGLVTGRTMFEKLRDQLTFLPCMQARRSKEMKYIPYDEDEIPNTETTKSK